MKAWRVGTIAAVLSFLSLPAHAAVIGLLGGDYDPDQINSGLTYPGGSCAAVNSQNDTDFFTNFQCVFYEFADLDSDESLDPITSIEFLLTGFAGPFTVDSTFSQLPVFGGPTLVPGSLRLSWGVITPDFFCELCTPVTGLALYAGPSEGETLPQLTFQTVAVNGQVVVPEPATIMLLGPGAFAMLLAARRARRSARV